jgi:outer membrane protein assembly factor BamE
MRQVLIIIMIGASLLTGCTGNHIPFVYKIDISQGNIVTQDMVSQLEKGMDKQRVAFVLGTPMLVDVFHQDRWDYVWYDKPGRGKATERRLSLFFQNDKLVRVEGDVEPKGYEPPVQPTPGPGAPPTEEDTVRPLEGMVETVGDAPVPGEEAGQ